MSWLERASFRRRLMRMDYSRVLIPRENEQIYGAISSAKNKSLHENGIPYYVFGPGERAWVIWWKKTSGGFAPRVQEVTWQEAMDAGQFASPE